MKQLVAIILLLAVIRLSRSSPDPRSRRQADECAPLTFDDSRCGSYLAGDSPPVLLISFDGFRSDYMKRMTEDEAQSLSPTLNLLARCGVQASSMVPVFPSLTFPNHYSIVTGLYPESHGIVNNNFYDPDLQLSFSLSNPNATQPYWWIGDPIWYTASEQGKKSATYFWPGSDMKDPIREPDYWFPYNGSVPYPERIQQVLDWLNLPVAERPHYLSLYLDEPDHEGHSFGPDSPNVGEQITAVDLQLKALLDGLEQKGILGCINILVVSDHGMASAPAGESLIILNKYIDNLLNTSRIYDGVFPNIRPNSDTLEEQDRIGRAIECQDPHMRVYNKWDLPRRHHYAQSDRIPSILLDLTVSWRAFVNSEYVLLGNHGWDNLNDEMQATFVAQGPAFRRGLTVPPFHNIELYNLMCHLLDIDPSPNNGTWGALHHMLVAPPPDPSRSPAIPPSILNYPADQSTYNSHLNKPTCTLLTMMNDPSTDASMNLTSNEAQEALKIHVPWGVPQSPQGTADVKTLVNRNRVTGFDVLSGVPLWVSYTPRVARQTNNVPLWRRDVRLEPNHRSLCDRLESRLSQNTALVPLFPLSFTDVFIEWDAQIDTNAVEVSPAFKTHWDHLFELVAQKIREGSLVNLLVGALLDDVRPALYAIVSACNGTFQDLPDCPVDKLDVQSFILPTNNRYSADCMDSDEFLAVNLATLKDVESLSGLDLYPTLSYSDKVSLLSRTPLSSHLIVDPDPESHLSNPPDPTPSSAISVRFVLNSITWSLILSFTVFRF